MVEKAIAKAQKIAKAGDKAAKARVCVAEKLLACLAEGHPVRSIETRTESEQEIIASMQLLSDKPIVYVANVAEDQLHDNPYVAQVRAHAASQNAEVVVVCAAIEAELSELSMDDKAALLDGYGLTESGLDHLIRIGYDMLGLQTFFTAGVQEVRAWTMRKGDNAQTAAGVIHTDFIKGFIRAEVVSYEAYIAHQGEQGAKEAGVWQLEGKEYVVQDGDVIYFRINAK